MILFYFRIIIHICPNLVCSSHVNMLLIIKPKNLVLLLLISNEFAVNYLQWYFFLFFCRKL